MPETDATLRELRKISKVLIMTNAKAIELELSRVATTDDRKKMWVLIDGERTSTDIANSVKVTPRAVRYFLTDAAHAELVDYTDDAPRKILDYVPPSWLELLIVTPPEPEDKATAENAATESKITSEGK